MFTGTSVIRTFHGNALVGNMLGYFLNPKNWFLSDKEKQIAKLNYALSGEELERALVRLEDPESRDFKIGMLNIDIKYNYINQGAYDKAVATLDNEPYVKVLSIDLDPKTPGAGYFELDFNEQFVEYLANSGYEGTEPEQIVDNWFSDLCRNIVLADLQDENGEPKSYMVDSKEGQIIQRLKMDDDRAEYS